MDQALDGKRNRLMDSATGWLDQEWRKVIDISPWISEKLLFNLLKTHFQDLDVIQHDTPAWLSLKKENDDQCLISKLKALEGNWAQHFRCIYKIRTPSLSTVLPEADVN